MTTYIPARPTVYNGIQMRSRLEADFASWLDTNRYIWEYEPRAYGNADGQYLPDFELHGKDGLATFAEVKPTEQFAWIGTKRMEIIWSSEPQAVLMVWWRGGDFWEHITGTKDAGWRYDCPDCDENEKWADAVTAERDELQDELDVLRAERDSLELKLLAIEARLVYEGNGKFEKVAAILGRQWTPP